MIKKLALLFAMAASPVLAQEKAFTLSAPDALIETGIIKHLIPRFSLKKGIRITLAEGGTDAKFGSDGAPIFRQGDTVWHFAKTDGPYTDAFQEWLLSDVGKRTIESYAQDGQAPFSTDVALRKEVKGEVLEGDVVLGEAVSLEKCGRCHVVNEKNRMNAIGSTPSFSLMRSFGDWQERFTAFYVLRPHAAFTQVVDVTEPFPADLPSPISPIELTVDEIEAITAYVASIKPADLGAPIQAGKAFQSP